MTKVRITRKAREDLEDIWSYISQDSPEAADGVIAAIIKTIKLIGNSPKIGRLREDLFTELRSIPVSAYIVFYKYLDRQVRIVRVVHGNRDITKLF